ncbi:hypothetical protein [Burkholderia gladioli]|uniref:hypothetical protein n=1 Tax=Burkholderia gladioli TaxID=28095 RepID=UPI00163FD27D|nr:hypothetical protein [Burkholderia gladioli]
MALASRKSCRIDFQLVYLTQPSNENIQAQAVFSASFITNQKIADFTCQPFQSRLLRLSETPFLPVRFDGFSADIFNRGNHRISLFRQNFIAENESLKDRMAIGIGEYRR